MFVDEEEIERIVEQSVRRVLARMSIPAGITPWGLRLRRLYRGAGYNQKTISKAIGVRSTTVYRWEHGESQPRISSLRKLAEVLDKPVDELVADLEMRGSASFCEAMRDIA